MFWKTTKPAQPTSGATGSPAQPASWVTASVTESAPCERSVRLRVPRETIAPFRASVLAEFQREATLPGFRKGKAPAALVERQHAEAIQDETLRRVTKHAFEQVANTHDLKPVGPFEVRRADFHQTEGLTLEATVEVEPSFTLADYKGIPLKAEAADVTPEEMSSALANLQESMAQLVPSVEGAPKERQLPAIDDELAKDLGFEHLEKLRTYVEAKLRERKRLSRAEAMESALCTELLRRHAFDVPQSRVTRQTEQLTRDFTARLLLSGVPEAQVTGEVAKFTEQLRTSAQERVKLAFILDRIAAQESLTVTEHELVGRLWQLAQHWKKDPSEVRKTFDAKGLWPSVFTAIRREKTIASVIASATIDTTAAQHPTETQTTAAQSGAHAGTASS